MFLNWSDDYKTGIKPIDDDHQKLFKAVNDLHNSYEINDTNSNFADLFQMLSKYVDEHFAREEEAMLGMGYPEPDFKSHVASHQGYASTVREYAKLYRSNPHAISRKEILKFLGNWLTEHILKRDMDYVPYIKPD